MDDRPLDADVVVVGGGPAGAATAIACAVRGLRVVLCERAPASRDRPGETLHPGVEPLLAQLGVADRLPRVVGARHAGTWVQWGGPPRFQAFGEDANGPWLGFQVWRADFDALLLERARELGVTVQMNCAVTHRRDDCVETAAGPVRARIVADATGSAHWLARSLGIDSPPRSPRLIARYGYVEGACPSRDAAPALVGDASGWTWSARVRPGVYQWTRVRFSEGTSTAACRRRSASTSLIPGDTIDANGPPDELRGLNPLGRTQGADVTWRMARQTAGVGWFMVGDAAATLDPTSSHGVLKALLTGITAGHLIAAVLAGKAPAAEAAAAYHAWMADWFATDAQRLATFYRDLGAAPFLRYAAANAQRESQA